VQRSARRALADRLDAVHPCAMRDDGKVLLNEIIRPAGEPIPESTFPDLTMLLFLHGRERTEAEYCQLLDSAGLRLHNVTPIASNPP
jgi:O-methyltransferase domain